MKARARAIRRLIDTRRSAHLDSYYRKRLRSILIYGRAPEYTTAELAAHRHAERNRRT